MGSFINNVPVRRQLDPTASLAEWLREMHRDQAMRFRYEYVSPTDLHRWSGLPPTQALFDLLLLRHSPATEKRSGATIEIEQLGGNLDSAFPLTLAIADNSGQLELTAIYDASLIEESTVQALLNDMHVIFELMIKEPTGSVGAFLMESSWKRDDKVRDIDQPQPVTKRRNAESDTQKVLTEIWQKTLGLQQVGLDDDFFALGGTSLQAALLFSEVERAFGKTLPLSALFSAGCVREFLTLLDAPVQRTSTLVAIQPHGTRAPFYVVAGIGGNVVGLAGLARALGASQPLFGLESPGLDGAEKPSLCIEDIAARYLSDMGHVSGDFVLFGICWGAAVALEMAQQLAAAGNPPARLVVMDPVRSELARKSATRTGAIASQESYALKFIFDRLKLYARDIVTLRGSERRQWLKQKMDLIRGIVRDRDLFRGSRIELNQNRVRDANMLALQRYDPKLYAGPAIVLMTEDREIGTATDPRREWLHFVPDNTPVIEIPGKDTGDALSPRHSGALADTLRRRVAIRRELEEIA
jgi:thioesterase domain-containing protein